MRRFPACLVAVLLLPATLVAQPPAPVLAPAASALTFAADTLVLTGGTRVPAELARLHVRERRGATEGRVIEVAVTRLRGVAGSGPATPVVFLPGSPGGASGTATLRAASLHPFFTALRAAGDVYVMDYRGSGRSRPRLDCPPVRPSGDAFASHATMAAYFLARDSACLAHLARAGIDARGYTWAEVARDVEALRAALGARALRVVGFSSGTHATLALLRESPGAVERAVLVGTEGPDHTWKLPSNADRQLHAVGALLAADSGLRRVVPDFPALVASVLARLDTQPVPIDVDAGDGARLRGAVGRAAVAFITSRSLSGPDELALLPPLYLSLSRGDAGVLTRVVQGFARRPPPNALSFLLDGASGVSPARHARITAEAARSPLGNAVNFPAAERRAALELPQLGDAFRAPVRSRVPTLFVTGALDGNTPPHQAEEIRRGFERGTHLVIENGGHGAAFELPDAHAAIVAFLRGEDVSRRRLAVPPPRLTLAARP